MSGMIDRSMAERIAMLEPDERAELVAALEPAALPPLLRHWGLFARRAQRPPRGRWRVWMIMAGRGFGKTLAGAHWVHDLARENPAARIALVGATMAEARSVMVEGPSGILATALPGERPRWEPALGRLTWPNGARAFVYSAAEPEMLRGPQHHAAWADEIGKWKNGEAAWDNLTLGLRCGLLPRVVATTTPRAVRLVKRLARDPDVARTNGRTQDNVNLARGALEGMEREYGGTRFGRQELGGELIEEVEDALWPRALIEAARVERSWTGSGAGLEEAPEERTDAEAESGAGAAGGRERRFFTRVVIGVDPPAGGSGSGSGSGGSGDACGIVAAGLGRDGVAYVLGDHSARGLSPDGWARRVAAAAEAHGADRIVAEANNGGKMVEAVLRGAGRTLPLKLVHAAESKVARAEPVAALFESGRARLAGRFPELEDELAGLSYGGGYEGPGRSPDRADAMVWALSELLLGKRRAEPRIRWL
jgi:phage terminase large subunit-like protein